MVKARRGVQRLLARIDEAGAESEGAGMEVTTDVLRRYDDLRRAQLRLLGGVVSEVARIPMTCGVLGEPGVRIAGSFEAARMTGGLFSPVRSVDCQQD